MKHSAAHPSLEDLRSVSALEDQPAEQLEWLSSRMEVLDFEDGEALVKEGDPAEEMIIFFEGEMRGEASNGNVFLVPRGRVSGLLPYSRMTHYGSLVTAVGQSRVGRLGKEYFAEMLERMPVLNERIVGVLSERIRWDASISQQREKLMALGKMSAGLAHELNNPAAAARRAADNLKIALESAQNSNLALEESGLPAASRLFLAQLERNWTKNACTYKPMDTLDRSEREEEFAEWLEKHKFEGAWEAAAALVDVGCTTVDDLDEISRNIPQEFLQNAIGRVTAAFTAARLVEEIQSSVTRISELVRRVKEYSYMDQGPVQRVNIHDGIDNTLILLKHRLKGGIDVVRQYDESIPKMSVRGSELNQVWTNLIGNAVDAMSGKGKLKIVTSHSERFVTVAITDSGPGIPEEVRSRIFDPFFTTKPLGEGTGLGLDVSKRIVINHSGELTFESEPGKTTFFIRLPIKE